MCDRPQLSRLTNERGGAMVEMAISMLVFVPVMLYALMFDDLLRFRMNLQETVISAQWDLTTRDYENGSSHAKQVQHAARLLYCDHSAAFNFYNAGNDCTGEAHHLALSAHQTWMKGNKETNQVHCKRESKDFDTEFPLDFLGPHSKILGEIQNGNHSGGLYSCTARLSVINDRITNQFMQEFSSHKVIEGNLDHGANGLSDVAHVNQGTLQGEPDNASGGYFQYPPYHAAILTDTWALNDVADMDQESESGHFFDRVQAGYTGSILYWGYFGASMAFLGQAWGKQLLTPGYGWFLGDNLFEADLAVHAGGLKFRNGVGTPSSSRTPTNDVSEEGSNVSYDVTPWKDWEKDNYKKTYQDTARGKYYMACKDPESC